MPPDACEVTAEVGQACGEVGQEGVGLVRPEALMNVDRLLDRAERLITQPEAGEDCAEVVQAPREVGQEGVGAA